jgi:hypothetical protein
MTHKPTVAVAGLACVAAFAAGPQLAQARRQANPGMLKVKPDNVMVNTTVTVKGKGLPPKSSVTLRECGRTFWIVPEEPCNTGNEVSVKTSARGSFVTSFKVEVCPEGMPGKVITERTCYIGVPKFGEDTVALSPSAKVIVTYP